MNNPKIEAEVLRLIKEIEKDETLIRCYKEESIKAFSEDSRNRASANAKMYEESYERKLKVLKTITL